MKDHEIVESRQNSDAAAAEVADPLLDALRAKKLGPTRVACIIDQAARAKTIRHHKIKGVIKEGSLGPGHKVVATAHGDLEDEHLIQHSSINFPIRLKAADQIVRLRGLAPKEERSGIFGGSTINVFTNIEPRKRLDKAAYARVIEATRGDDAD